MKPSKPRWDHSTLHTKIITNHLIASTFAGRLDALEAACRGLFGEPDVEAVSTELIQAILDQFPCQKPQLPIANIDQRFLCHLKASNTPQPTFSCYRKKAYLMRYAKFAPIGHPLPAKEASYFAFRICKLQIAIAQPLCICADIPGLNPNRLTFMHI